MEILAVLVANVFLCLQSILGDIFLIRSEGVTDCVLSVFANRHIVSLFSWYPGTCKNS